MATRGIFLFPPLSRQSWGMSIITWLSFEPAMVGADAFDIILEVMITLYIPCPTEPYLLFKQTGNWKVHYKIDIHYCAIKLTNAQNYQKIQAYLQRRIHILNTQFSSSWYGLSHYSINCQQSFQWVVRVYPMSCHQGQHRREAICASQSLYKTAITTQGGIRGTFSIRTLWLERNFSAK